MSNTTASNARIIVTSTSTSRVVQVMSDVWETMNFFTGTEIVNGEIVSFDEMCRGQEKPVVNATEADIKSARGVLRNALWNDLMDMDISLSGKVVDLVEVGALVKVVRGRKVPVGTTGTIVKQGVSQFGRWLLILKDDATKVFVAVQNVEVIDPLFGDAQPIAERAGKQFISDVTANEVALDANARRGLKDAVQSALRSARWQKTNARREWVQKVARGW